MSDVDDRTTSTPIKINQDANIHVTEVMPGSEVSFVLKEGRQAYLLCVEGSGVFTGTHGEEKLVQHDAAELFGPNEFVVRSADGSVPVHVLLVEMAFTGVGRTDL